MSRVKGVFVSHLKKFGERVFSVRGSLGVEEFAGMLGVSRKTIQRWEDGISLPDGNSLLKFKEKFGVDPTWLLSGDAPALHAEQETAPYGMVLTAADEIQHIENYRATSEEKKKTLREVGAALAQRIGKGCDKKTG
jgi:transcriptional regulator with XRE-family HTH domain